MHFKDLDWKNVPEFEKSVTYIGACNSDMNAYCFKTKIWRNGHGAIPPMFLAKLDYLFVIEDGDILLIKSRRPKDESFGHLVQAKGVINIGCIEFT